MGKSTTLIAKRTRVGGRIETDGDVVIEGRVEGAVVAGGRVVVAESGMAVAQIQAARAEIEGLVIGNVMATERIGVAAGARVVGDLRAPDVSLQNGAIVEGTVDRRSVDRRELPRADAETDDRASAWAPDPVTEPRGRTTLREAAAPVVRPGRPVARAASAGGGPPSLPRPAARAKLQLRKRRAQPT
ncbi:MAG TPA: polymer-forming cytoskeletal protein [Haliangiales bacterium]|nr:polymer-forming cytoskeletal protein [Haliangiales bacterium]